MAPNSLLRPLVLLLFALASVALHAQLDRRLEALQAIQQGDMLLRLGNSEQAYILYTNAIQMDPALADGYMKRASLLQRTGRYLEARSDIDKALGLNPMSSYILDRRAKLNILLSDYKGAEQDMQQARFLAPYDDLLRKARVDEWLAIERPDMALRELDTLLQKEPNDAQFMVKRGFIHLELSALDSAQATAEAVLRKAPSALAWDLLGLVRLQRGDARGALAAFDTAIVRSPGTAVTWYNRSVAKRALGDQQGALRDLDEAIARGQDRSHFHFNRALVRKELGDLEGALADYDAVLKGSPQEVDALFNRAFTLKLLGDQNAAMWDAEEALRLDPNDALAWNLKGDLHLLFGEFPEAILHYERAIGLSPDAAAHHYDRGMAYLMSYQLLQGCDDLRRAMDLGLEKATEAYRNFCSF
jgi:tetratricopeptide (TPR) repeat protein